MKKSKRVVPITLEDIFVSAVMVLRPELRDVSEIILKTSDILSSHYTNYEIILIDNGAPEEEVNAIADMLATVPCLRLIKLTQQFKYDSAIFAGLEVSIGDYVCTFDPITDDAKDIIKIVKLNQSHDVVQGVSTTPIGSTYLNRLGRKVFYWYNRKYVGIDIPLNATYHAGYTRRAINALTANSTRRHRHIRHLSRKVGFNYGKFDYTPLANPNIQRGLRTGIIEALEITTSYSTHPLRFVTWLGVFASFINIMYAFYVLYLNVFGDELAAGWTSTSMQLSVMFFILFIILIILSEYIGRLLTEVHRDPSYLVLDELVSTTSLKDKNRRNVTQ